MNRLTRVLPCAALPGLAFAVLAAPDSSRVTVPLLPAEPQPADLERLRAILHRWEGAAPQKAKRVMRVVYWTPADRDPQPAYRERLTRVMISMQNFYATQMAASGFPGRSIGLNIAEDALPQLPAVKGTLKSAGCSEQDGLDGQATAQTRCAGRFQGFSERYKISRPLHECRQRYRQRSRRMVRTAAGALN